jgi:hypothetical protein
MIQSAVRPYGARFRQKSQPLTGWNPNPNPKVGTVICVQTLKAVMAQAATLNPNPNPNHQFCPKH